MNVMVRMKEWKVNLDLLAITIPLKELQLQESLQAIQSGTFISEQVTKELK